MQDRNIINGTSAENKGQQYGKVKYFCIFTLLNKKLKVYGKQRIDFGGGSPTR